MIENFTPKAVLFDLDGTLLDTAADFLLAMNLLLTETNNSPIPMQGFKEVISHGSEGMLQHALGINKSHPEFNELQQRFLDHYAANIATNTKLFDGINAVLEHLETKALKWGIVTNKAERYALPLLEALNLLDRAHCVVCGDTTSHMKPHPAPLLHASSKIRQEPTSCVFIGDHAADINAAKAANMPSVVALYGYIPDIATAQSWGANAQVKSPLELINLVS